MERGVVAVMEVFRAADSGTGQKKDVVALNEKVGILETDILRVRFIAPVQNILDKRPFITIP